MTNLFVQKADGSLHHLGGNDVRALLQALPVTPENPNVQVTVEDSTIHVKVLALEQWPLHADSVRVETRLQGEEAWNFLANIGLSEGPSLSYAEGGANLQLRFVAVNTNGTAEGDYVTV